MLEFLSSAVSNICGLPMLRFYPVSQLFQNNSEIGIGIKYAENMFIRI